MRGGETITTPHPFETTLRNDPPTGDKKMTNEVYDPKAKKNLDSVAINGVNVLLNSRVKYIGSSPCFVGKSGKLMKIKRQWVSAKQMSRSGFGGSPPGYAISVTVLWDDGGVGGCSPCEIESIS